MATEGILRKIKRPEHKLLICVARVLMDPTNTAQFRALLQRELDWEYLIRASHRHGLMPLFYHHLNSNCPEFVPVDAFNKLRNHFKANARRNLLLTRELLKLLSLFRANEIHAVPYKGPVLAASVYGNLALREFMDLDFLVRKQDILRAKELLLSQGYEPGYLLTNEQEAFHLRTNFEYQFDRHDDGVHVDMHWEVVPRYFCFPLDSNGLWKRLELVPIGGVEVPTFSPEDLLQILCVHGAHHLWERFEWISSVAELIRVRNGMDWERVIEQAGALNSERKLFVGLFLASDLLGAALPEEVMHRVRSDPKVRSLAEQASERIFQDTCSDPGVVEKALFHARVMERPQDKALYFLRLTTIPNLGDWNLLALPPFLSFLYYVIRPVRLLFSEIAKRLRVPSRKKIAVPSGSLETADTGLQ